MNSFFFCLLTASLFIYPAKSSSNVKFNNNPIGICYLITTDTVTMSNKELKDSNGDVIGIRYTLINNIGTAIKVEWSFPAAINCYSSGGFSGVESLIGYGYVDITTFTQKDKTKQWSEGAYTTTIKKN